MTVYRHQEKWRFDFWKKGQRFRGSGYRTKQEAKDAEAEARKNVKKTNLDFIRLCAGRLRDVKAKRTLKYLKENLKLIKKLVKAWGQKREITREDVEIFLNKTAGRSTFVANKELRFIKALFNHGIERNMLMHNPTKGIKPYPVAKKRKYIPPEEDIRKVFAAAEPDDRIYLLIVAHTLGRVTTVNNLRWEDVHFTENYVSLYTRKSKNSDLKEIKVPMNRVLRQCFTVIEKIGEYVLTNPDTGKPYGYRKRLIVGLCKKVGVKPFSYHALRHFGASKLDNRGAALTDIQKLLGHERATTTDIYLQSLRGSTEETVKLLEDLE